MNAPLEHLLQIVRRQPKRAAMLAILLIVAAVVWVQMRNQLPRRASAERAMHDEGASSGVSAVPDIGRSAEIVRLWRSQPVPHLSRNLFVSRLTLPPAETAMSADQSPRSEEEGLFWRQLERAMASRADRELYRRSLVEAAIADASALELTSIVIGPHSTALINGKLLGRGDVIAEGERGSFTIVSIEPSRVVLARDGHRLAIRLGKPGAEFSAE